MQILACPLRLTVPLSVTRVRDVTVHLGSWFHRQIPAGKTELKCQSRSKGHDSASCVLLLPVEG